MKRMFTMAALFVLGTGVLMAQDGAATYKAKCAMCHGPGGEGKPNMGVALKGTKLSEAEIVTFLEKGDASKKAPHSKAYVSDAAQAKAVAAYVKTLK